MSVESAIDLWIPATAGEREAVQEQLERLLAAPLFHASKRYPSFLRFVTANALAGHTDLLKERMIGIEVFGRAPDYDTTTDPIVRVTAAEIRKRLDQYYHEPEHAGELRIVLPSGSYIPHFSLASTAASPLAAHLVVPAELEITAGSTRKRRWIALITLSAAVVTAVVIAAFSVWRSQDDRAFKEFWRPMLSSGGPILFCVADQSQYSTMTLRSAADPSRQHTITDTITAVVIDDVTPLVNIAGLLHSNQRSYRVKNEASTTLTDLRQNPTVLVGAFDNAWTLRETADLRFHFANREDMSRLWIEDRANPGKLDWLLDRSEQQKGVYKDFAIVARFIDPNTDQLVIVVAGIARGGTVAAGEFLIDQHQINDLAKHAPYDWAKKNMELVLETQVIDGRSGPPRLVASYFW
jgi:hypothetical protein